MNNHNFGCDFGSYHLKVYHKEADEYMIQHNMVAVQDKKGMLAYGDEAYAMYEKAPSDIHVTNPMSSGNLASISNMQAFLRNLLEKSIKGQLKGADYFVALPTDMQERIFTTLIQDSNMKPKNVYLVDKPVAAGLGLGINVKEAQGVMIVDIGGGTTDIAVISLGGTVVSTSIKIAGDDFDEAIVRYMRKKHNLLIGERTAEEIKIQIGSAYRRPEVVTLDVRGRNLVTGLPKTITVTSDETEEALKEATSQIVEAVHSVLEKTPPELAADIADRGIVLTGGGCLLQGLEELIEEKTGINTMTAEDPMTAVAIGTGKFIEFLSGKRD